MLGALRQANVSLSALRQGKWGQASLPMAHDPQGKTLGILGMGSIGRNFAAKARAFMVTLPSLLLSLRTSVTEKDGQEKDRKSVV